MSEDWLNGQDVMVILLRGNTRTARKAQKLLRKFKWEVWIHQSGSHMKPSWVPNTYLEQGSLQRVIVRELTQWIGRDFCQTRKTSRSCVQINA
ncbi:hypothetical protein AVEN_13736-1 [Araneus ventricosus]|uniref:Uncharacterized protein n=1 Tax=Araneus ventricosus TaxID=182803 RepID=A0A4Y2LIV0_ARAVE|nr:hypothetical protein AVEN_13736-1 [Araneus ventricosus]